MNYNEKKNADQSLNQTAIIELINDKFGHKIIEGFSADSFSRCSKKPKEYNFSFISKNKNGKIILIRIINQNEVLNNNDLTTLNNWIKILHTIEPGKKYAPYGPDYLCICVVVNNGQIEPNILNKEKFYYTEYDIQKLYLNNLDRPTENKIINPHNVENIIYNHIKAWEVYRKFYKNDEINQLFTNEFELKEIIGPLVSSCIDYNPISFYDAANHYFTYAEQNKHLYVKERGLTKNETIEVAIRFARRVSEVTNNKITMTTDEAFHYLMYITINKMFIGYLAEKNLSEIFIKDGFLVFKANAELDKDYGVDLIVKTDKTKFAIQVKSKWFLQHIKNEDIVKLKAQYIKTLKEENLQTYYAFYRCDENNNYVWEVFENNSNLADISFIENLYQNEQK